MAGTLLLQAPSGISKFDPLPHAMRVEPSASRGRSDPLARVLEFFQSRDSAKVRSCYQEHAVLHALCITEHLYPRLHLCA